MNIQKIESRDNPRLKQARKVRDGADAEHIFIEGVRLAEEAVRSGIEIVECFVETPVEREGRIARLIEKVTRQTREIFELNQKTFSTISDTKSPQGIVLIGKRPLTDRSRFEQAYSSRSAGLPLVMMLTEINNPANLGAVIRTAEAAGTLGIIVGKNSADVFSTKALRGSMGSAFRLPIWARAETFDVVEWARANRFSLVGAVLAGEKIYSELDWKEPRLLVMGSEAHGIPPNVANVLDEKIKIPMASEVESLNLAVAAAVIMFEARRQVNTELKR